MLYVVISNSPCTGKQTNNAGAYVMTIGIENTYTIVGEAIRVRGIVQGVGFRPTVWRIANACGLAGEVVNDADGVLINVMGYIENLDEFVKRLENEAPPLARIDSIERQPIKNFVTDDQFRIQSSKTGDPQTGIAPDAATCGSCIEDVLNPENRRFRYPFTNCTHCGPRFSIIKTIPYDRCNTSMSAFTMCGACNDEYQDPPDRRFHAQPNACPVCGPYIWLEHADNKELSNNALTKKNNLDTVCTLLKQGGIVAIKGIGGFHLACDAINENAVKRLRQRKQRYYKPFALMARNIEIVRRYCEVDAVEEQLLLSTSAPIVLLKMNKVDKVADTVAPGHTHLGFMLPYSPIHHLILKHMEHPIILTSGNLSDEPQCIDNKTAKQKLNSIVDYFLFHDREIVNRVDDSVVRIVANDIQILRRARGYAPAPLILPDGFSNCPEVLAMGGELKNTFCLIKDDKAILSQHLGDLENAATFFDYRKNIDLYHKLYETKPEVIAIDLHPDYLSSKEGRKLSEETRTTLNIVQHHHAHIASCMAENQIPLDTRPVLGVALDGLGFGEDGTFWGGEFLLTDYVNYERLATFMPIAMLGGMQAIYEPWRNTYAHIIATIGWSKYKEDFKDLELTKFFESMPLATYDGMLENKVNSPLASSCGRLFDAVAAAIGICREQVGYEGQAAIEMEAIVDDSALYEEDKTLDYPFSISILNGKDMPCIDPATMWQAILKDISLNTPKSVMAARFHKGVAKQICTIITRLTSDNQGSRIIDTIALSGGVFQNKILTELIIMQLKAEHFNVLTHRKLPANDGGLSLGQAVIATARTIVA